MPTARGAGQRSSRDTKRPGAPSRPPTPPSDGASIRTRPHGDSPERGPPDGRPGPHARPAPAAELPGRWHRRFGRRTGCHRAAVLRSTSSCDPSRRISASRPSASSSRAPARMDPSGQEPSRERVASWSSRTPRPPRSVARHDHGTDVSQGDGVTPDGVLQRASCRTVLRVEGAAYGGWRNRGVLPSACGLRAGWE